MVCWLLVDRVARAFVLMADSVQLGTSPVDGVDVDEQSGQRDTEPAGQECGRSERGQRPAVLEGGDVTLRQRRPELGLGEPEAAAPVADRPTEGDRERGAWAVIPIFSNS